MPDPCPAARRLQHHRIEPQPCRQAHLREMQLGCLGRRHPRRRRTRLDLGSPEGHGVPGDATQLDPPGDRGRKSRVGRRRIEPSAAGSFGRCSICSTQLTACRECQQRSEAGSTRAAQAAGASSKVGACRLTDALPQHWQIWCNTGPADQRLACKEQRGLRWRASNAAQARSPRPLSASLNHVVCSGRSLRAARGLPARGRFGPWPPAGEATMRLPQGPH